MDMKTKKNIIGYAAAIVAISAVGFAGSVIGGCNNGSQTSTVGQDTPLAKAKTLDEKIAAVQADPTMSDRAKQITIDMLKAHWNGSNGGAKTTQ